MAWELNEVPGKTAPSLQDSTVDVVAAKIEPKLANALIRQLSQVCPLENLRHVKRVRRHIECDGKPELSIILCLSTGSETFSDELSEDVQKIVNTYQLSPFIAKVAKCAATSKEEWEEQCKLWPTSYHPAHEFARPTHLLVLLLSLKHVNKVQGKIMLWLKPKMNELLKVPITTKRLEVFKSLLVGSKASPTGGTAPSGGNDCILTGHFDQLHQQSQLLSLVVLVIVRGFREAELPSIFNCMKTAIQLSKGGNAAIIVDPSSMQIIAKATDKTHQHDKSEEGKKDDEKADDNCSLNESTEKDSDLFCSSSYLSESNGLNMAVPCINPWGWTKQRTTEQKLLPCEGYFAWHPLRHAAIAAIENAADRDRMLYPSSISITKSNSNGNLDNYSNNEPAKRLKTDTKDKEQSAYEACCGDLSETTRPYLCTGFDIYLVWEPCTMCAMALVHQRFKRVFYAFPNPITGALGGVYRLHGEKSLNHHYTVFRISVPEEYLNASI
ncbi:hypothetical protein ACP70R_009277 [Stipagrostis hirtigluma subsp. patula]